MGRKRPIESSGNEKNLKTQGVSLSSEVVIGGAKSHVFRSTTQVAQPSDTSRMNGEG